MWDAFLRISVGTVVNQQVDFSIAFELAVNAKLLVREPWMSVQQRLNDTIFKTDDFILRWRLFREPKAIDRIQAGLAQRFCTESRSMADCTPVNWICCIPMIRVGMGMDITFCFFIDQAIAGHIASRFSN